MNTDRKGDDLIALSKRLAISHGLDIAQEIITQILEGKLPVDKWKERADMYAKREGYYQSRTIKASQSPKIEREFYGGSRKDRQDY